MTERIGLLRRSDATPRFVGEVLQEGHMVLRLPLIGRIGRHHDDEPFTVRQNNSHPSGDQAATLIPGALDELAQPRAVQERN